MSADIVRVEGDPPEISAIPEGFRNERRVRMAVRTALAQVVRPLTGILPVDKAFDVVGEELLALREWFMGQVKKKENGNGNSV